MDGVITKAGGTTEWEHDVESTKFANELRNTAFESIGEGIQVLHLSTTLDKREISTPLILRPRVKLLWESVLQDIQDNPKNTTMSIVTGNPGIGKTRSMDYLLRLLLRKDELVFYGQRENGVVYVFVPPRVHQLDDNYRVYSTENFAGKETWLSDQSGQSPPIYLVNPAIDGVNATENKLLRGDMHCHLVIAASPNPKDVKGWWKSPSNLKRHIMPSWTLNELLAVCPSYFEIKKEDVISRFCRYGGVLRAIVGDRQGYEGCLQEGVAALPPDTMKNMLLGKIIGIDSENVHVNSGLYRIEPDPKDCSRAITSFASPYTCALVAGKFWETIEQKGLGSGRRYTKWFEYLCMLVVAKGGTFQARPLLAKSCKKTLELKLNESNVVEYKEDDDDSNDETEEVCKLNANDNFYKKWALNNATTNTILAPRTMNLPVVDFVYYLPHPIITFAIIRGWYLNRKDKISQS